MERRIITRKRGWQREMRMKWEVREKKEEEKPARNKSAADWAPVTNALLSSDSSGVIEWTRQQTKQKKKGKREREQGWQPNESIWFWYSQPAPTKSLHYRNSIIWRALLMAIRPVYEEDSLQHHSQHHSQRLFWSVMHVRHTSGGFYRGACRAISVLCCHPGCWILYSMLLWLQSHP